MGKYRISFKNIGIWFADQLMHPLTLFKRKSWGVFSKYAHVRRSDGLPKKSSVDKAAAKRTADFMAAKYGGSYTFYKCVYCDGWHVAKETTATIDVTAPEVDVIREKDIPVNVDFDAILKLDIPDIARVYGGVRGRTMSSKHQDFAWPIIKQTGIRQIIDLREDGRHTRLNYLCDKFGIDYFFFPVDRKCDAISTMVDLFPTLCEKIDTGNFYISCAMGLHRTDIALCCYWIFHSADKGLKPPAIRGYRKTTEKIMRVLNAIYKEFERKNGQAPISQKVFNERKKIIELQSS